MQRYASYAYHGGYNSCSEVGYFPQNTYDYDLKNAYPTAMCLVPDIDWENPVRVQVQNRNMDIRDFCYLVAYSIHWFHLLDIVNLSFLIM